MTTTTKKTCITKPMLAGTLPPDAAADTLSFPVAATPKLDGIRALVVDGCLVSRQFKPIPNAWLREALEAVLPEGADGEVIYGDTFQECTSAVMTRHTAPMPGKGKFKYYWFDYGACEVFGEPYMQRMEAMRKYVKSTKGLKKAAVEIVPLYPTLLKDAAELEAFEASCLSQGYEGVIVRKPDGKYKCGRSTLREGLMLKIKRFMDAEATVVGWEELQHNHNKATVDALGHKKRSSHKANLSGGDKLGALLVVTASGVNFSIGTGFSDEQRVALWQDREQLLGKIVKYKYFEVGVKDAPRHPVFLGFRSPDDM